MGWFRKDKRLPFIPVQPSDQSAAFAGLQYQIESSYNNDAWTYRRLSHIGSVFKDTITRLVYSNFIWYGLESYEAQAIESMLITNGVVGAIKSKFDIATETPSGVFFGKYSQLGDMYDFYGRPTSAMVTGLNGKELISNDYSGWCVGFDTTAITVLRPTTPPLYTYIHRLAYELDFAYQALQVAVETHKQGMIFKVNSTSEEKILKDVLRKISANNPYIIIRGGDDLRDIDPVLFAPSSSQAVSDYYDNFQNAWSLVLDLIGLEHSSQQKKERLVVDEAQQNNSLARYAGADRLRARKIFADELNSKFGLNVKVENYLRSIAEEAQNNADKYGEQEDKKNDTADSGNNI